MGQHPSERNLIITADDYGASKNINEGIRYAADQKVLTTISALTNFEEAMADLKDISLAHPGIGIGVHLNIVTGKPILEPGLIPSLVCEGSRFRSLEEILPYLRNISLDELRLELRSQILALKKHSIRIDHLSDQCGILSLYSPFFNIVIELAQEFNVPVRSPLVASVKYSSVFSNKAMKKNGQRRALKLASTSPLKALRLLKYTRTRTMEKKLDILRELEIPHPDLLIDSFWGDPTSANLISILDNVPHGTSELILHLGTSSRQDEYPSGLDLDYFINREKELITITGDHLRGYCQQLSIKLTGYSDL